MVGVSVIIPAYNAGSIIERCIAALSNQTMPPQEYEIIVVDDCSSDDTAQRAAWAGARVLHTAVNCGSGGARNVGLAEAQGDIIVFTDADCEPTSDFLERLVEPLSDPEVGGTKGVYLTRQTELTARFVQIEYEDRYRRTETQEWIDFVDTYAACFRRSDLERVGGFDERLRQCGDQELSFRLAEAGVRIRFVPEARTYHLHAHTLASYLHKKFRIAWWKVAVLRRHPGKLISDSHTPQTLKLEMVTACAICESVGLVPVLALLGFGAASVIPLLANLVGFLALATPFSLRALQKDTAVGLAAPGIVFLRDLALTAGLIAGTLQMPRTVPTIEPAGSTQPARSGSIRA